MQAGQLRHAIRIQAPDVTRGASGGFKKNAWLDLLAQPIRSAVENRSGAKRVSTSQGGEVAIATVVFTMRYVRGVTADMRVLHAGQAYKIQHVNNVDERGAWLVLTCEVGAAP